jgi:hypothetical protein
LEEMRVLDDSILDACERGDIAQLWTVRSR